MENFSTRQKTPPSLFQSYGMTTIIECGNNTFKFQGPGFLYNHLSSKIHYNSL